MVEDDDSARKNIKLHFHHKMMKLVVFVLFFLLFSVQSKITIPSGKILVYAGDPFTVVCDKPNANWKLDGKELASCTCPSSGCNEFNTSITAFCNGSNPVLHFKSTKLYNRGSLKCTSQSSVNFVLLVGNHSNQFHPEDNSPFALVGNDYTLVCKKGISKDLAFYNEQRRLVSFVSDCYKFLPKYDEQKIDITCETNKGKLKLKQVTLNDDGKIFGCEISTKLYLFTLTVNVPVTSVLLLTTSKPQIEGEHKIFVCIVEESKPKASFQWIIFHRNGSSNVIQQKSLISTKANGKLWQTNSTLTLELKRSYQRIWCQAKIENMPWKNSDNKVLDIQYSPPGKPIIIMPKSPLCTEEEIKIECKWPGGNPEADVKLTCLSKVQTSKSPVSITNIVTQEMDRACICEGIHIAKNDVTTKNLIIHYPPKKVIINQTSYLQTKPASLICSAFGGYPDDYKYSWSPRNYPSKKKITIDLTQFSNGEEITCTVNYNCSGNNFKSSTVKLKVEKYPVIKMKDNITVIENKMKELSCRTEGNPQPTTQWKIGNNVIKSKLLQVSFTRHNASYIQCIGISHSTIHGLLRSYKNISIFVLYPPDVTITHNVKELHGKAEIICKAEGRPNNITYRMIQKWGKTEKRIIESSQNNFANLSFQDLGKWICRASNDIPKKGDYIEKSVEIKINVPAQFKGEADVNLTVGVKKKSKVCFYCHPKATEIKWYKGNEEISSDKVFYVPAEDGLFPFTGNCSILELEVNENTHQMYYLKVRNPAGQTKFELTADSGPPTGPNIYIIVSCVIAVLIIFIIIGALLYVKFRRSSKKKQSDNNGVDKNDSKDVGEMIDNSLYGNFSDVSNNAASDIEPLYAQVNKPSKRLPKVNNANVEELYANVDKSKNSQSQDKNANVEELYAKIDKSKDFQSQGKNAPSIVPLYAQVNKPSKNVSKVNNENVDELYAKVDKSKNFQSQDKNANVEELYAKVDKSKNNQSQDKKEENNSLYANVDSKSPNKNTPKTKVDPSKSASKPPPKIKKKPIKPPPVLPGKAELEAKPDEEIYENLELEEKKAEDKELMYVDIDFHNKPKIKPKPMKRNEDQTMYASIDFGQMKTDN